MLLVNDQGILSLGSPIEGREFTRYFSGFSVTSLDQELIAYHKKTIQSKHWKDIGSGQEVFLCRKKIEDKDLEHIREICVKYGQLMLRGDAIHGIQVHVPLTSDYLGKEDYFTGLVNELRGQGYVIVQSIVQTKDYPLVQWSITDPALLQTLVSMMKEIENTEGTDIVQNIVAIDRRDNILAELVNRCEQQGGDASLLDEYDIALLKCDT